MGSGATTYAGVPVGSTYTMADLRDLSSTDFETLAHSAGTLVVTNVVKDGEVVVWE